MIIKLIRIFLLTFLKEINRKNLFFDLLKYGFLPVMVSLTFTTKNEVIGWITIVLLIGLLATLVSVIAYLLSQRLIERIATIKSWSYAWDDKYSGYSIQANRKLIGISWSTNEYLSGSEEEAKRLTDLKNK